MGTFESIHMLDLFAGAGGFSLGFHNAGFLPGVMIDKSVNAFESLAVNFGPVGAEVLQRDLSKFTPKDLEKYLSDKGIRSHFDLIIGGPPCQGWSQVGRGKLRSLGIGKDGIFNDPRNVLYRRFIAFIRHFQPKVCVMENVPGMLSHSGTNVAELVARHLDDEGYSVSWNLLNTVEFGVPQVRKRLIFVGVRKDLKIKYEMPSTIDSKGKPLYQTVTVKDAIGDLPVIRNGCSDWVRDYIPAREASEFAVRMRKGADTSKVFDHVCRNQNDQDLEAFRLLKQGGWYRDLPKKYKRYRDDIFEDKYKKLYWDKPSWCVTAHLSKDSYTHIHPTQARTISIREAARLQSFPDWFYFSGSLGGKFELIGNAVPPAFGEAIATSIRKQIFEKVVPPRRSVKRSTSSKRSSEVSL